MVNKAPPDRQGHAFRGRPEAIDAPPFLVSAVPYQYGQFVSPRVASRECVDRIRGYRAQVVTPKDRRPDMVQAACSRPGSLIHSDASGDLRGALMEELDDSVVVFSFEDGWRIIELLTKFDYQREGGLIGNCVGMFYDGPHTIYSLRNSLNEPRANILLVGREVTEVAGRYNTVPEPKYLKRVRRFLAERGYTVAPTAFLITELRSRNLERTQNETRRYGAG